MQNASIYDLDLAGIRWEITEVPMVTLIAERNTMQELSRRAVASDITAQTVTNRTATLIVPPIAPVQSVSIDTVRAMAARPIDLESLLRMIAEFKHPLRSNVTNVVLPHIAPQPNGLVIVTDIPGADDDATGRILSGGAGELLDKMLGAIGFSRENVSILPMLFWRTPGGRGPTKEELDLSRPFVNRVLEMLKPRLILTLGALPALEIAGVQLPRGHGVLVNTKDGINMMPIFHPNYLMLKPTAKRDAWNALQIVQNLLKTV